VWDGSLNLAGQLKLKKTMNQTVPAVTCADDVRTAFPDASFGVRTIVLFSQERTVVCDRDDFVLDGVFSPRQLLALAYWLQHPEAFKDEEPPRLGGAAAIYDALTGSPYGAAAE
jgi:hypothetical protein